MYKLMHALIGVLPVAKIATRTNEEPKMDTTHLKLCTNFQSFPKTEKV